jgi:3-oxoadipate enol-lactonase
LLLGGFACDHTFWAPIAPRLASKYRVISPDNRGSGQSSSPDGGYTAAQLADDAAALLDHLGVETAHVAGHSMGGQVAQELALNHSARVRSLTLISTGARASARLRSVVESAAKLTLHASPETCCRDFLPWMFTEAFFETPGAVDAALARMLNNPHTPVPRGLAGQSAGIGLFDASARVGSIRPPTLVVVGAEDILTPPARSRDLAGRIPGAELVVLERGAHDLVNENPEPLLDAMLAFLSRFPPL